MGFIYSRLFSKKLEICILGLEGSGKTTFVKQLMGENLKTVPTIGLNVKSCKKGSLSLKIWDIGGQFQYRQNWVDYAKLCDVIVFLVDASKVGILLKYILYLMLYSMKQFPHQRRNFNHY